MLTRLNPRRAGSIRANFLDSSGTPFFESTLDPISPCGNPPLGTLDLAGGHLPERVEGAVSAERGRLPGVSGRRRGPRSSLGHHAEGFRRGHQCTAGGGTEAVSQLPAHRAPLSAGACPF